MVQNFIQNLGLHPENFASRLRVFCQNVPRNYDFRKISLNTPKRNEVLPNISRILNLEKICEIIKNMKPVLEKVLFMLKRLSAFLATYYLRFAQAIYYGQWSAHGI